MSVGDYLNYLLKQGDKEAKKIIFYGRSMKLDVDDLLTIAANYTRMLSDNRNLTGILTPLHVACVKSKPDTVEALLQEGYCVNAAHENVNSFLGTALVNGNIPVARLLLTKGADVMGKCYKKTAMQSALETVKGEKGCLNAVKLLVEFGVSVNADAILESKTKPLHWAVRRNYPSVLSFLLQKGADGNCVDSEKNTPLHIACFFNNSEIVKLLTLHKVHLYKENNAKETPMLTALSKKPYNKDVIRALTKGGCDINKDMRHGNWSPLHYSVFESNLEKIKFLVGLGANPNLNLKEVGTPLHAVSERHRMSNVSLEKKMIVDSLEIIKFLVEKGADVNAVISNSEITPLELAVGNKFFTVAKLLIRLGADVNGYCSTGNSIFFHAASHDSNIITTFLEYGADYNNSIPFFTPYHNALRYYVDVKYIKEFVKFGCPFDQLVSLNHLLQICSEDVQEFLVAQERFFRYLKKNNLGHVKKAVGAGAEPTGCSTVCRYPLHFVALKGYKGLVLYLLENSFPANYLNRNDKSALFFAAKRGHYEICCKLLQFGACYSYSSKKCPKTPAMIALEFNHEVIVDLFKRVDKMFYLARVSHTKFINNIMEVCERSPNELLMFLNASNVKGETLLSTALRFNQNKSAEKIMQLRISFEL